MHASPGRPSPSGGRYELSAAMHARALETLNQRYPPAGALPLAQAYNNLGACAVAMGLECAERLFKRAHALLFDQVKASRPATLPLVTSRLTLLTLYTLLT